MKLDRKIKVCHIITRLDHGGSATNTLETMARLNRDSFEVTLISGKTQLIELKEIALFAQKHNIKIIFVEEMQREIHLLKDWLAYIKILKLLKEGQYDIVHTHSSKAGIIGRWAAKKLNIKTIIHTPHGHIFYGYFNKIFTNILIMLEEFTSEFTNIIICLTPSERSDYLNIKFAPKEKFTVIPSGIDLAIFHNKRSQPEILQLREKLNILHNAFIIGYVGRLDPVKNVDTIVRAAATITQKIPNAHFLMVGDGFKRKELEKLTFDLRLSHHFHWVGYQEKVVNYFNCMDLFILPSKNEGMGRVLIEAMACRVPIIATKVGSIPYLIEDGINGKLVPPQNFIALSQATISLCLNPSLRHQFIENAFSRVTREYDINQMVEQIAQLYLNYFSKQATPANINK